MRPTRCQKCGQCDGGYYGSAQELSWVECEGPPKRKPAASDTPLAIATEMTKQQPACACTTCRFLRMLAGAKAGTPKE